MYSRAVKRRKGRGPAALGSPGEAMAPPELPAGFVVVPAPPLPPAGLPVMPPGTIAPAPVLFPEPLPMGVPGALPLPPLTPGAAVPVPPAGALPPTCAVQPRARAKRATALAVFREDGSLFIAVLSSGWESGIRESNWTLAGSSIGGEHRV